MVLDFDLNSFIEDMKACKPPYRCPFEKCGKVFKTYKGIHGHILTHDNNGDADNDNDNSRTSGEKKKNKQHSDLPFFKSPQKDTLVFNEAAKQLEFEAEGRMYKFSIYDALELVDRKVWEESLPLIETHNSNTNTDENNTEPEAAAAADKEDLNNSTPRARPWLKKKKKSSIKDKREQNSESEEKSASEVQEKKSSVLKLPEAVFTELDDYELTNAPLRKATSYFRFIEKPSEEQDEEVEYDLDEEDVAWLDLINAQRKKDNLNAVGEDQFELLMDRLEKESYFHVQTSSNGGQLENPVDDDAICCVCMDGECSNTNVILFCDLCNLAVHQECYGVPYIPEGQWLCRRCLQSPSRSVACCLCPNKGGAFKQTDDGRWAHVVCGLWIPEVRFANTVFLEPIDSIDRIPPARWKLSCRVCKQRGAGACIQCHKTNCYTAFHVTCGLLAGLHMKMDTVRESNASGSLSVTVRKTAFCDVHTPADSDCRPKLDDVAALGISTPKMQKSPVKKMEASPPLPVLFRGLMNFSPQCPWDKVQEIANLINVQRKNQFFQRLMAYWTLKRQTRNGVPLIRRLQFAKAMRSDKKLKSPNAASSATTALSAVSGVKKGDKKQSTPMKKAVKKAKDEFKAMLEQRRQLRRLRQDLEKVRLLCELIRKREQRKREIVANLAEQISLKCWPMIVFLTNVMDQLQSVDVQEIFAEPVSLDDVPDYLDHITRPMDFRTMRKKLSSFAYKSVDDFESDFTVMVENCLSYNERDTIFYRAGVKMRDQGGSIIRQARRMMASIGFDGQTALHSKERSHHAQGETLSDDKLMKEIDGYINEEHAESEEHLKKLLELQDKANFLHHPVAKVKRMKILRQEITKTRRKLSLAKSGLSPGVKAPNKAPASARKGREVSPVASTEEGSRRLRGPSAGAEKGKASPGPKRGKKRGRNSNSNSEETPKKKSHSESPAKSPGVNRRNAVLFTRKKQAQAEEEMIQMEEQETEVRSPAPPQAMPANEPPAPEVKEKKKRGRKPKNPPPVQPPQPVKKGKDEEDDSKKVIDDSWKPKAATSASFREYRRGGEVGETDDDTQSSESATDAMLATSDDDNNEDDDDGDSGSDNSDSDSDTSRSRSTNIPLEPLDLVWAKCRGYPWYPALIINPKMPRTGYLHNGVPIPVPPVEVLEMANTHQTPHYLILFFDAKRTWQWLTRDKLEPLGVELETDKAKLMQSKKPSDRKAVKKAYEDAILHRVRVTGDSATLSDANITTDDDDEDDDDDSASNKE